MYSYKYSTSKNIHIRILYTVWYLDRKKKGVFYIVVVVVVHVDVS